VYPSSLNRWSSSFLPDEAAALAFMCEDEHDIRPSLLLLFHAQDCTQFPRVHACGVAHLIGLAAKRHERLRREVAEYAAGDALAVMWCRRAPEPVSARSRRLGVRNATYFGLRTAALLMYQDRLHEARVRFASGTTYTRETPSSKTRVSPSREPVAYAPSDVEQPSFNRVA
jgi:hypothetical protein